MAINIGSSVYGGNVLEDLLIHAVGGNDTVDKNLVHVKSGIQFKYTLPGIRINKVIQDNVPTPVSSTSKGDYTINERYLEPQDFMVYLEFNPRDYEKYWDFTQPENPLVFRELDPAIQATMLRLLIKQKNLEISEGIWMSTKGGGVSSTVTPAGGTALGTDMNKYYDGLMKRLLYSAEKDTAPEKVIRAGSTSLDTGEKVRAALYGMFQKCPHAIRTNKSELTYVVNYDLWDLYDEYLTSQGFKYKDDTEENALKFKGIKIIPVNHVPADTMILAKFGGGQDSNFWLGVDYANDSTIVQVSPLQNNSELWFFKMVMKMDTNILKPGEIVLWTPYTHS